LEESRKTGRPLRVKAGFDPTAPDLHLGHTVLMRKLKHFQDLGHQVIFLVGDFTSLIGDPTGRSVTRKPLTLSRSLRTRRPTPTRSSAFSTVTRRGAFQLRVVGNAGLRGHHPAGGTLHRLADAGARGVPQRFQEEKPIALHEMLYPLSQGYDSVALKADVELGGNRPAVQPADWPGVAAALWPALADRADDADHRGPGRRAEDVEVG